MIIRACTTFQCTYVYIYNNFFEHPILNHLVKLHLLLLLLLDTSLHWLLRARPSPTHSFTSSSWSSSRWSTWSRRRWRRRNWSWSGSGCRRWLWRAVPSGATGCCIDWTAGCGPGRRRRRGFRSERRRGGSCPRRHRRSRTPRRRRWSARCPRR